MSEAESREPTRQGTVGGASAFGGRPPVITLALRQGGGLLYWARVRDRAARQWAEVPPMRDAEAELRAAHAQAMEQAPREAKAREGRGIGMPKLEVFPTCKVRVDVNWSGVQHHIYPTILSPAACAAVWKLWVEPLPVAEIPRPLPATFQGPARGEGRVVGEGPTADFESEDQLETYIVSNWDKLPFSKWLEIVGRQHPTSRRERIDILCRNRDESGYTPIELKLGLASDGAVGQVLRYMAWVRGNRVKGDQSVWGLIICRDANPRLRDAILETPNVEVYTYVLHGGSVVFSKLPKKD